MGSDDGAFRQFGGQLRAFLDGLGAGSSGCQPQQPLLPEHPFPPAGIDGFLSYFVFSLRFDTGPLKGQVINLTLPNAIQTVARSEPFIYRGPPQEVQVPLPQGCTLSPTIRDQDFLQRPPEFFQVGKEAVWLQILDLDARGDTSVGPIRIILGETLKREFPDLFQPSLGVAQSLGVSGFPARLFFDPTAIMQTQAGNFRAVHGVLAYGRIEAFPPVGSSVQTTDIIPLHSVEALRRAALTSTAAVSDGSVLGLSHPITAALNVSGDEAFSIVQQRTTLG